MRQFLALLVIAILLFGCVNISDSAKAGSFGKKASEQKAYDYFTAKYGSPEGTGSPRFIEPMMTTFVDSDFMPADKVLKYSKDVPAFYVWFFYDNFGTGDTITVTFRYLDDGTEIHTFTSKGGGDYGAASFKLEKPNDGWPLGKYEAVISGKGVTERVPFEVIDGATVKTALPYETAGATPPSAPEQPPASGPATTAGMTSDSIVFDTTPGYIGACSLTDTSSFTLTSQIDASLLQVWYNWGSGESTLTYSLAKDGSSFMDGALVRADCDPYQGNWCNGNQKISKTFPAGNYVLTLPNKKMCLEPGKTGTVRIYGKTTAAAPSGTGTGAYSEPAPKITGCNMVGTWQWTVHQIVYQYEDGSMKAFDNGVQAATGTYEKQADGTYYVKWTPGWTGYFKFDSTCKKLVGANQYTADQSATKLSDSTVPSSVPFVPIDTPAHMASCVYAGTWNTDWGTMTLAQDGSKVTGTYTHDSGKASGTIVDGVYVGKWSEAPTYGEPGDAGDMIFYFTNDCNGFTGTWHYGVHTSGAWSGTWVGTKAA